jgi:hypothetical protein
MRQVLFFIGCVLFFLGLFAFGLAIIIGFTDNEWGWSPAKDLNKNVYFSTVLFFVGTYLISNNKPEDK